MLVSSTIRRLIFLVLWTCCAGLLISTTASGEEPQQPNLLATQEPADSNSAPKLKAEDAEFFEQHIRPLLIKHCYECHSAETKNLKGGLLLDSRPGWLAGGDSGEAIIPGKPAESLLIQAVQYGEETSQMPPAGKLPAKDIALLTDWVRRGAPDPRTNTSKLPRRKAIDLAEGRNFWSFRPPVLPKVPKVQDNTWVQSPIDAFILADLESAGLQPSAPADKRTLLRRVTFDLIGLPPTMDEMAAFLADDRPDAYEYAVNRLLASPHYGERWARHWLDIARYADSNGYDENMAYGNAWKYRDYVVDAFNTDLPYNEFLTEQIAGDLLPAPADGNFDLRRRQLIATGFLSLGAKVVAEPDKTKMAMDIVDEQLDTVGRSLLGLTLGCARCHDHKFDPIPTADYYALAGIFRSTRTMGESKSIVTPWYENVLLPTSEQEKKETPSAEMPTALGVTELDPVNLKIHIRGEHLNLGDEVPRGFLQVLSSKGSQAKISAEQSGRLELAQWITRPEHPLTARVLVNRLWRWHFGTGIVRTPDNFGLLGERPTNGPLLDFLAVKFVQQGWSIKAMHRMMVLSSTYQMSSSYHAEAARQDPENHLYWRMNLQRLTADQLRDAMLLTTGQLDRTLGGSLLTLKNRDYVFNHTSKDMTGYDSNRRSIYLPVIRNHLYEAFQLFDFPDPNYLSGNRSTTTVAPQALFFMNNETVLEQTRLLAEELLADTALADDADRIHALYQRTYGRPAHSKELTQASEFLLHCQQLVANGNIDQTNDRTAWQMFCQVVLSSSEFLYVR